MVVCDQVELRPGARSFDICCYETWEGEKTYTSNGAQNCPVGEKQDFLFIYLFLVFSHLSSTFHSHDVSLTQDVLMSHQKGLVDLGLSEPALLLRGEEDFHGHPLPSPLAHPDLAVSTFADLLHHLNLLGNGPLHLESK